MSQQGTHELVRVELGRVPYREAWDLQRELVALRRTGAIPDLLLTCEHEEVVTTGRKAQGPTRSSDETAGVLAAGLDVIEVERGGAATYHGPGQLVGYPIVQLAPDERDLHAFLRFLEGSLIGPLSALGLEAGRRPDYTGVWVGPRKVASIGIACRGWVTYHGFALNLSLDLERFRLFRPCDLEASVMADLRTLGSTPDREELSQAVLIELAASLGRTPRLARGEPSGETLAERVVAQLAS
ncbi:MAG: lipoyl(octanoyl) transferase LipB [Planctomycetes bacterium]|nr:lipoyl(octanoyl) transferase LipB [Planctomycetota bacterium]